MRFKSSRAVALAFAALLMLTPPAAAAQTVPDPAAVAAEQAARLAARQYVCTPVPSAGEPIIIDGTSDGNSAPFTLQASAYRVTWATNASPKFSQVEMSSADPSSYYHQTIMDMGAMPGPTSGETYIYKVQPGTYYLHVRALSLWSIAFTPIAV